MTDTLHVRRAQPSEAQALADLQNRSSQHWGYPVDFFEWAPDALHIPEDYIAHNPVFLLEAEGRILGFYGITKEAGSLVLDKLFVDLGETGKGYGRHLWLHAVETTRNLGYRHLLIGSDPNAAAFYRAMGATWLEEKRTGNPDWTVQLFRYDVPELHIRPARRSEAAALHDLTQRSVMYWGYDPAFLDWEPEAIAVTPEFLDATISYVLTERQNTLGYYSLWQKAEGLYLDKLFVDPERIGTGLGKRLWVHAITTARGTDVATLLIDADPNAAPFYRAMGAEWIGETEMSWPDWRLQHFRLTLQAPS